MRILSEKIFNQLEETRRVFSEFQKKTIATCPEKCGKCCFKPDIFCNPYEFLPLALYLIETNLAENILEKAKEEIHNNCIFLKITNEKEGLGFCTQYQYRPFVCRVFGLAGRKNKFNEIEHLICGELKEKFFHSTYTPPIINEWKIKLISLDPKLAESEMPINQALITILEKCIFLKSISPL